MTSDLIDIEDCAISFPQHKRERLFFDDEQAIFEDSICKDLIIKIREHLTSQTRPKNHLNTDAFRFGLRNYKPHEEAVHFCERTETGWTVTRNLNIKCRGVQQNYRATILNIRKALKKLLHRVQLGYIWGPWDPDSQRVPDLLSDPIFWPQFYKDEMDGLNPKTRVLTNFSDKSLGLSFNDNIYEDEKSCHYPSIIDIIIKIMKYNLLYIWAIDAHEAYYRVPVKNRFLVES